MNIINSQIINNKYYQNTINSPISFNGVGIHSGKAVNMTLFPADDDFGIVFKRIDLDINNHIKVKPDNIDFSKYCSKLKNEHGVHVSTVEHLLATLHSFDINNVLIEINSPELPAMDGSSYEFANRLMEVGLRIQTKPKKVLRILKKVSIKEGVRSIKILPSNYLSFSIKINFSNNLIGKDHYFYTHNTQNFIDEVCYARTFCVSKDVLKLRAAGFGLGGNLNNAIVVEDNKILNNSGLRCDKEFVKHKTLDCIGDFYMSGLPLIGSVHATQPGHELNNRLLKKIFLNEKNYEIVEINPYHIPILNQENIINNINVA
tara:strand:+ start:104 stop:1054 length:951 start_codon:yes stop_codon:yes gene_type:complete